MQFKKLCTYLTVALAAVIIGAVPSGAQGLLPGNEPAIGMIPGTNMTHDEFRARARIQLMAVALNAITYRVINGDYPESFYELYNSNCWNLDPANMFSGAVINAVQFVPAAEHMTAGGEVGLPFDVTYTPPPPPPPSEGEEGDAGGLFSGLGADMPSLPQPLRVNPDMVQNATPGDIFYYASNDVLQLIMYAADGSYYEHFSPSPYGQMQASVSLVRNGNWWIQDVLAAQVLYFAGEVVPQHYNHVMYMSDQEPLPGSMLNAVDGQARLDMAAELDILILNPFSKAPITIEAEFSRGNYLLSATNQPVPLVLCLEGKRAMSLAQIVAEHKELDQTQRGGGREPMEKPTASPLGGRR